MEEKLLQRKMNFPFMRKTSSKLQLLLFFMMVFSLVSQAHVVGGNKGMNSFLKVTSAPVPLPTGLPIQVYAGTANLSQLIVKGIDGAEILWYDTATGGSPLNPAEIELSDGSTYFASQSTIEGESSRLAVTVKKISESTQKVLFESTVAALKSAPGACGAAQWFADAQGGDVLSDDFVLEDGRTYYIEQKGAITSLGRDFNSPQGIAVDNDGNIYVADTYNNAIKKLNANGDVIGVFEGFTSPQGVAVDTDGKIYVTGNYEMKKMDADGANLETFGSGFIYPMGVTVDIDGKIYVADGYYDGIKRMNADGTNPETLGNGFNFPQGVAVDKNRKIYVADTFNNAIKKMDADGSNIEPVSNDFIYPRMIAVDDDLNVYEADIYKSTIKKMGSDGNVITTFSGGFSTPQALVVDKYGNLYITEDYVVKKINPNVISNRVPVTVLLRSPAPTGLETQVYAGDDTATLADLRINEADIQWYDDQDNEEPLDIATKLQDEVTYYAQQTVGGLDSFRLAVTAKKISDAEQIFCLPGVMGELSSTPSWGTIGQWFENATAETALSKEATLESKTYYVGQTGTVSSLNNGFYNPFGVAVDHDGNIYVADQFNAIKKMDAKGNVIATFTDGVGIPYGVAVDVIGNIYVLDRVNSFVVKMDAKGNVIKTFNGFNSPQGIAVDGEGNIYVADTGVNAIKKIDDQGIPIETFEDGFYSPRGIAVDKYKNIYVADTYHSVVKKIDAIDKSIVTLGENFASPQGVAVDDFGNVYVADTYNNDIKKMNALGENIVPLGKDFYSPYGIAVDDLGNTYFTDGNKSVTKIGGTNSNRVAVNVEVHNVLAPTGESGQLLSQNKRVDEIVIEKDSDAVVEWYRTQEDALAQLNPLSPSDLLEVGEYFAMQNINGCRNSDPLVVTISPTLGVNQLETAGLKYYPNQVKDVLTISNDHAISSVKVFNLLGQQVIAASPNSENTTIDMAGLPSGSYLVQVNSEGKSTMIKVIKE